MNVDMLNHLQYQIQMFGIPIDKPKIIFSNEAVYKNTVLIDSDIKIGTNLLTINFVCKKWMLV